jgi:putative endonuclease
MNARSSAWFVYFVRCADGTLYCGVATNVARRVKEHNASPKGAKYTRARRPVVKVWSQKQPSRSAALRREYELKRLTRAQKERLITRRSRRSA